MPSHDWNMDIGPTSGNPTGVAPLVIATSTTAADATIPLNLPTGNNPTQLNAGSFWLLVVAGAPAYLNFNGVATSANALYPVGTQLIVQIPPGAVVSALASFGTGQVSLTHMLRNWM